MEKEKLDKEINLNSNKLLKDDIIYVQESMVNLLIRVSAIEKILHSKNILIDEEYQEAIKQVGIQVTETLKKLYDSSSTTEEKETQEK